MTSKADLGNAEYNAKDASAGADVARVNRIEQLKQQLQELEVQLTAAHKLQAEIISPTETAGRTPLFVYYTDCRQEINELLTEQKRLIFQLENDHD